MKYQLPVVAELNDLDFQFEHDTIQDALNYLITFVKQNKKELIKILGFESNKKQYRKRQRIWNCANDRVVIRSVETKLRIATGKTLRQDWLLWVPAFLKNDKQVLMNVHQKFLEKYMIDKNIAFYDNTHLGIKQKEAKERVLLNELLRLLILNFPDKPLGEIEEDTTQKQISQLTRIKNESLFKASEIKNKKNSLLYMMYMASASRIDDQINEVKFSNSLTVNQKAGNTYEKVINRGPYNWHPGYTSIKEKENVIRQYLKMQCPVVKKSKNTRSKGINAVKKQKVLTYKTNNPKAFISEIARNCNVDRKTVRKYLNE